MTSLVILAGQTKNNVPFNLTKLLSLVLLFCILLTITVYNKQMCSGRNVGLADGISEVSNKIFAGWKALFVYNHVPVQTSPLVKENFTDMQPDRRIP